MENFIVIKFQNPNGTTLGVRDYPKDLFIPSNGDKIDMTDDEGTNRIGRVSKREITVRADFTEIKIIVIV